MKTRKIISKRHTTNIQKRIKFSTLVTITNSSCYIYLIPQTHTHTQVPYIQVYTIWCARVNIAKYIGGKHMHLLIVTVQAPVTI